ncbi:hypothetical protein GGR92_001234 [Spirosoma lacussanchae]|uniref:hypothetical protein n=1 Tax=Spirosoma lacussanchae TaxID=1884249 RepID=UPI001108B7C0|nr:hypothetical protein [Spirosoma lacussanchae]
MTSVNKTLLISAFCALAFYSYGTAMMDYFVAYPSRALMGVPNFVTYHALHEQRMIPEHIIPFLLLTILNGLIIWKRPAGISGWLLWVSLVCLLIDWLLMLFVPMSATLPSTLPEEQGHTLMRLVIDTNNGRILLESVHTVLAFIMLCQHAIYGINQRLTDQPVGSH